MASALFLDSYFTIHVPSRPLPRHAAQSDAAHVSAIVQDAEDSGGRSQLYYDENLTIYLILTSPTPPTPTFLRSIHPSLELSYLPSSSPSSSSPNSPPTSFRLTLNGSSSLPPPSPAPGWKRPPLTPNPVPSTSPSTSAPGGGGGTPGGGNGVLAWSLPKPKAGPWVGDGRAVWMFEGNVPVVKIRGGSEDVAARLMATTVFRDEGGDDSLRPSAQGELEVRRTNGVNGVETEEVDLGAGGQSKEEESKEGEEEEDEYELGDDWAEIDLLGGLDAKSNTGFKLSRLSRSRSKSQPQASKPLPAPPSQNQHQRRSSHSKKAEAIPSLRRSFLKTYSLTHALSTRLRPLLLPSRSLIPSSSSSSKRRDILESDEDESLVLSVEISALVPFSLSRIRIPQADGLGVQELMPMKLKTGEEALFLFRVRRGERTDAVVVMVTGTPYELLPIDEKEVEEEAEKEEGRVRYPTEEYETHWSFALDGWGPPPPTPATAPIPPSSISQHPHQSAAGGGDIQQKTIVAGSKRHTIAGLSSLSRQHHQSRASIENKRISFPVTVAPTITTSPASFSHIQIESPGSASFDPSSNLATTLSTNPNAPPPPTPAFPPPNNPKERGHLVQPSVRRPPALARIPERGGSGAVPPANVAVTSGGGGSRKRPEPLRFVGGMEGERKGMGVDESQDGEEGLLVSVSLIPLREYEDVSSVDEEQDEGFPRSYSLGSGGANSKLEAVAEEEEASFTSFIMGRGGSGGLGGGSGNGNGNGKTVGVHDVFLVQVFILNRSPTTRRFTVGIPTRWEGGRYVQNVKRAAVAAAASSRAGGESGPGGMGVLYAKTKEVDSRKAGIIPLENGARVGPLPQGTCQSVRLRLLALRPGTHTVKELEIVEVETGRLHRLRNALTVVVK
ncbi:hypothetical protein BT69DRAFT_1350798 [Atractiella rhizophila]|nr:hypothetical protein BT69DRAFT_1350798 [Atractiella rhizophila]